MSKVFKALCPGCSTLMSGQLFSDFVPVCARCSEDLSEVTKLYTEIVTQRPWLRKKSPAEVFRALWSSWQHLQQER